MAESSEPVQLTDLQVIQQFSLAVRGATADRAAVVAALQADLAWLTGARAGGGGEPAPRSRATATKSAAKAKTTRARKA